MAQTKLRSLDLAGMTPPEIDRTSQQTNPRVERSDTLPLVGSITISFFDSGGQMVPEVSFAPLGRINPNTIERILPFIYQAIQRQQVIERQT